MGEERISELVDICKRIYEGVWPTEFTKAVTIPSMKMNEIQIHQPNYTCGKDLT